MNKAYRPYYPRVVEILHESVPFAPITFCADSEFDCGSNYPNDRRNLSLVCNEDSPPFLAITGTAFPGEVLTAYGGEGDYQWYVEDQWITGTGPISGATGDTYTVRTRDIGRNIYCVRGLLTSNKIRCWHPKDENGCELAFVFNEEIYGSHDGGTTVTPIASTQFGAGGLWEIRDLVSGDYRGRSSVASFFLSGARMQIRSAESGTGDFYVQFHTNIDTNPASLLFPSHFRLDIEGTGSKHPGDIFRNKPYGYIINCARSPYLGNEAQRICNYSVSTDSQVVRVSDYATVASSPHGRGAARRLDSDNLVDAFTLEPRDDKFRVTTTAALWAQNKLIYRMDGEVQDESDFLLTGANSEDTRSFYTVLGNASTATQPFKQARISCHFALTPNAPLSASALSRLERFAGLLGGLNIPLV